MRRTLLFIFVASAPAAIAAQAPTIPLGTRVRVEMQGKIKVDGTLMSQTEDSIIVSSPGTLRTVVASESVARIRVSEGRSHAQGAVRGMKIGTVVAGGGVALIFGAAYIESTENNKSIALLFAFVAAGAVTGAMYGAAIGGIFGAERWTTVYSSPVRVSFRPAQSGAPGVGVSIWF